MAFEDLSKAQQHKYSSAYWFKLLFNSIQAGILIIDAKTKTVVDVNPAAALIMGLRRENIIGTRCFLCKCSDTIGDECSDIDSECPIVSSDLEIENEICVLNRKDGSKLNLLITVTSVLWGGRRFLIKSFVDVTNFEENRGSWTEVEELLSSNIARMKDMYKDVGKDTTKVKQSLRQALSLIVGG